LTPGSSKGLEDFKRLGVTQRMLTHVVSDSFRIDPAHRDLNFREVLRLKQLHQDPRRR
jgi:hypothetical protein